MDTFEKQQRIESINGIIKVRWFIAIIIVGLGFVLKIKYFGWASGFQGDTISGYLKMVAFGSIAFGYNLVFWLIMKRLARKPVEKINDKTLSIVSVLQIIPDQIMFTLVYYNTGTVDSMSFVFYFISVLLASSLYKTKGIILTGLLSGFFYTMLLIVEYQGIIPHFNTYQGVTLFGSPYVTKGKIVTFICYIGIMTFVAAFLSNLIRRREKNLREQRDKLYEQTHVLAVQTNELAQAQGQLQGALSRSDIAGRAATQARDEMEKANTELQKKIDELEKFYKITVGREVRMVELKGKIKELEKKIKGKEEN